MCVAYVCFIYSFEIVHKNKKEEEALKEEEELSDALARFFVLC